MVNDYGGMCVKEALQIIIGLLFLVGMLYLLTYSSWFWATIHLIQGGIIILLFFIGIGLVLLGASELKE